MPALIGPGLRYRSGTRMRRPGSLPPVPGPCLGTGKKNAGDKGLPAGGAAKRDTGV